MKRNRNRMAPMPGEIVNARGKVIRSEDFLSGFLESARSNESVSERKLSDWYRRFVEIDAGFERIAGNLDQSEDFFAGFFLLRSHCAFRAATRLVLSLLTIEAFIVMRGCLEFALYGLLLQEHPEEILPWLRRGESKEATDRSKIKIGDCWEVLDGRDADLKRIARALYERTIDIGAHPNQLAITGTLEMTKTEKRIELVMDYFVGRTEKGAALRDLGLKTLAQIGVTSLGIFEQIFQYRFEIMRLSDDLERLREGL